MVTRKRRYVHLNGRNYRDKNNYWERAERDLWAVMRSKRGSENETNKSIFDTHSLCQKDIMTLSF